MKALTGKACSVPAGLGLSLTVNVLITAISVAVMAAMLSRNTVSWENTGYYIMLMLLIASFAGGKTAIAAIKHQRYLVSLMSGILYWMFLMCLTALLWGGQYSSVTETGALIIAGSTAAALLSRHRKQRNAQIRRYSYR